MRIELFNIVAQADSTSEAIAGLDGLASFADALSVNMLKIFSSGHADETIRNAAAARYMLLDPKAGSQVVANRLQSLSVGEDPSEMIRMALSSQEGPTMLATALDAVSIHPDIARASLNELGSSGLSIPELTKALRRAGKLDKVAGWKLTPKQRAGLLAEVAASGEAAAGERVYRRKDMACQKCHAIGGAGGQVGPDLASIGASAQPDYILESLLEPSKKIKENYHSLVIVNDEGKVITGIKLRETKDDLLLRNAEDEIFRVPLDSIDERADGGSLMPSGLVDSLTRAELVNLVRYLSELGKIGSYALPRQQFVRTWESLSCSDRPMAISPTELTTWLTGNRHAWSRTYSVINGDLPIEDLPQFGINGKKHSAVRFSLTNSNPNAIIHITPTTGLRIWKDGKETEMDADIRLSQSENEFVFLIDRSAIVDSISVEIK